MTVPMVNFKFDNRGVPAAFSAFHLHKRTRHDERDFQFWESKNGEFIDNDLKFLLHIQSFPNPDRFSSYELEPHAKVLQLFSELPQLGWTTTQKAGHVHRVSVAGQIYK